MSHNVDLSLLIPDAEPLPPFADPVAARMRAAEVLLPPKRMQVAEAAERYRIVHNPGGGYTGPWDNAMTPYMVEPMNMLTSRLFEAEIFVGPAQSGKTDALILNWAGHGMVCDPADMLIVQTTKDQARDFSKRRVDRMIRHSPDILARTSQLKADNNVFDKIFRGGILTLGFPSIDVLSSKPIPRVAFTDYDRMTENVDGEGAPFDLGRTRTRTFGSAGMTLAESSPGRPVQKPKWTPPEGEPHRAPPTTGVLALYNRGDRRRWHWPCPHCGEYFEGEFDNLNWPDGASPEEAAQSVTMTCPANGCVIEPKHRKSMNASGIWVTEGCWIAPDGTARGTARSSSIVSYWLKGTAAAFSTWGELVKKYIEAVTDFETTGSEETIKTTTNVDQGLPYLPKAAEHEGSLEAQDLIDRAEDYSLRVVPDGARFLIASVDVQSNRFDVMIRAFGPGLESWVVDWFTIFKAPSAGGGDQPVDPATRLEDWGLLLTGVLAKTYPLADKSGVMSIARMVVDSGGAAGVTDNAYDFWRLTCRKHNKRRAVLLLKGTGAPTAPRFARRLPDSERKDRKAKARGEVPVGFFNSNLMKDALDAQLRREDEGAKRLHLSSDLLDDKPPHTFFEQATAEARQPDGKWKKTKARNEVIDLLVMSHAGALSLKADRIVWDHPKNTPGWARAWAENSMVEHVKTKTETDVKTDPSTPTKVKRQRHGNRRGGFVNSWR